MKLFAFSHKTEYVKALSIVLLSRPLESVFIHAQNLGNNFMYEIIYLKEVERKMCEAIVILVL